MSEKTTPTASEVNRRIAIWMGHRDFEYVTLDDGSLMARRTSDGAALHEFPDYMQSASAAIAAAEKLCRERDAILTVWSDGTKHDVQIDGLRFNTKQADKSFATAISTALFAVLGEGS